MSRDSVYIDRSRYQDADEWLKQERVKILTSAAIPKEE
jgi:hypothetical protein